jgi:hypothetical protein
LTFEVVEAGLSELAASPPPVGSREEDKEETLLEDAAASKLVTLRHVLSSSLKISLSSRSRLN